MNNQHQLISELFQLRNKFGSGFSSRKKEVLEQINVEQLKSKLAIETFYNTLLFIMAYPGDKTIQELFERQVEKTPDNIAVVYEDTRLTYKELNDKSLSG